MDTSWTNKFCAQRYVKAWGWMKKKNVIQRSNENNLYTLKNYYQQQDKDSNSHLCVRNSLVHYQVLDGKGKEKENEAKRRERERTECELLLYVESVSLLLRFILLYPHST